MPQSLGRIGRGRFDCAQSLRSTCSPLNQSPTLGERAGRQRGSDAPHSLVVSRNPVPLSHSTSVRSLELRRSRWSAVRQFQVSHVRHLSLAICVPQRITHDSSGSTSFGIGSEVVGCSLTTYTASNCGTRVWPRNAKYSARPLLVDRRGN